MAINYAAVAPNPASGTNLEFHFALTGPAQRVRIRVLTAASRVVRETTVYDPPWAQPVQIPMGLTDSLGAPLANGNYHFLIEAFEYGEVADSKAGNFFVLR